MFHLLWEEKEIFVSPGDADWKVTKQNISIMYVYKRKQRYIFCVKVNKCAFFTKKVQSLNLNVWLWRFDNEMSKYFGKFKCPLFSAFMLICKLSSISCQPNDISRLMKSVWHTFPGLGFSWKRPFTSSTTAGNGKDPPVMTMWYWSGLAIA